MFQRNCNNRLSSPVSALFQMSAFAASVAVVPLLLLLGSTSYADGQKEKICSLPPDPGPCDGVCPRWFFNTETGECEMFIWGCCDGNANNFESLEECEAVCGDSCPADITGDGTVGTADLLALFAAWGICEDSGDCPADLDNNNVVDTADLLILFENWGPCP